MGTTQDLEIRAKQREKYLEDPNFRKWSDIIARDNESYGDIVEKHMLVRYLKNNRYGQISELGELITNNLDNPEINWYGIYAYLDERERTSPSWLRYEVDELRPYVEPYRDKICPPSEFIGY